ncbi:hypothetical protein Bca52824_040756 [Brassica carinata]|uniref:Nudix hydrolase n=1 Tax=Brassica carinata TaxID=52824 RepID=A0A8X7RU27_BRACI|nr:hypothetical protein Bca52824_040756 [Brassica carinata]
MESGAQQIFVAKEDNYGGLVVNLMEMEHMTAQDFESKLDLNGRFRFQLVESSLEMLIRPTPTGKRGIWIKLSSQLSSLVDSAIKVLVVQEIGGRFKGTGVWKLPTGVIQEACILTCGRSGGVLHVSWTCSLTCGARGAATRCVRAILATHGLPPTLS